MTFLYLPDRVVKIERRRRRQPRPRQHRHVQPALPRHRRRAHRHRPRGRASSSSRATSPRPTASRSTTSRKSSLTGPATVILAGISVGLESAVYSALLIGAAVFARLPARRRLGPARRCSPSRSPAPACSPPSASSSRWTPSARSRTTRRASRRCPATSPRRAPRCSPSLDAVGNTTKAITKGIAIATAVLAATALFGAFRDTVVTRHAGGDRRRRRRRTCPDASDQCAVQRGPRRRQPAQPRRSDHRCGGRVPVLRPGHQRGVPRGRCGDLRGASPVPRPPRDHGRHREAGVRQGRRHRHARLAP